MTWVFQELSFHPYSTWTCMSVVSPSVDVSIAGCRHTHLIGTVQYRRWPCCKTDLTLMPPFSIAMQDSRVVVRQKLLQIGHAWSHCQVRNKVVVILSRQDLDEGIAHLIARENMNHVRGSLTRWVYRSLECVMCFSLALSIKNWRHHSTAAHQ